MSFTSSNALWRSADGVSNQFPVGLRVLVVDDDPTCLRILEKMLKNCLYEVTTCNRAEIALDFLRDTRNVYDIVISDVHMPDMDGFKLLEHVGLEMDLPVIMMSADDSKNVVMKGVTHGACDYLIKPVRMEALKNIWQHVFRKKKYEWKEKDLEESGSMEEQKISEDLDYSSSANEGNLNSSKRMKDDEDEVEDRDGTSESKKARVVWSIELHQQFVTAVNQLGLDKAVPNKILELMNVPGLSRENVASHLQKYRLYLRRLSCVSHHSGLPDSFIGPSDFPFGPMPPLNAVDRQDLATSGQLTPQNLARIQAAALSRATATNEIPSQPHLVNQRNIFSFENPNLRYLDWPHSQQNNSSKQLKNLLHGTPTNMHVRPHANRNNPLLMPMVQTQNFNEVNSSVSQPILSRAIPSQPSPIVDFSSQSADFQGNSFPLAKNTGMFCLSSRPQEEVNAEVKRCRGFIPSYAVLGSINRDRTQDWCLQNVVSSVQGGQSRVGSVNRTAFSVAEGFGNTAIVGQQVNSSLADILLRNKVERMPNTGFQDGFLHEHVGQDELISALLREPHEGVGPIENEFGFDGYHLDNFYPV